MYLGMLINALTTHPWLTPIAIGLNPHSIEWKLLFKRLLSKSDRAADGDLSCQENTIPNEDLEQLILFFDTIWPLTGVARLIREHLIRSIVHPVVVVKRRAFHFARGQGSGNYLTAWFNSFSLLLLMLRTWRWLGYPDADFYKNVALSLMGDDSLMTTIKAYSKFNRNSIAAYASTLGMFYTSASKSGVFSDTAPLLDTVFLKRRFHVVRDFVFAPLERDVILEIMQFEDKRATQEDVANSWRSVLIEARHHGITFYTRLYDLCLRHVKYTFLKGLTPELPRTAILSLLHDMGSYNDHHNLVVVELDAILE
jgi:hypothetical protein